jgi:hypothetical protein
VLLAQTTRVNDQGFVECIDTDTGEVLWVEKKKKPSPGKIEKGSSPGPGRPTKESLETHHYVMDGTGQKLWVPKGTNPDHLPKTIYPYSKITADHVCQLITEGNTIRGIGKMEGMPPAHVINKWVRKYPEFKREMREAVEARATHYADTVMEVAETTSKETIMEDRLKTELYKWRAEVDDPDSYGKKTKVTGNVGGPMVIIIDTGINTREEPKEVDSTVIEQEKIDGPDL